MSKDTEYDAEGYAVPGTYPISVVSIAGRGEGGKPMASIRSAVCDSCGEWASNVWNAGETTTSKEGDFLTDVRVSRRLTVTVYACPDHSEQIMKALVDEYGSASNAVSEDELALLVDKSQRADFPA